MKAKIIPTIVVDTREKCGWDFDPEIANVVHFGLKSGDYSIAGFESVVSVERKSLSDFVGCCVQSWRRFKAELDRLRGYRFACVAVEANVEDVLARRYQSDLHPHSVLGRATAIHLDYGVPVFFWGSRPQARWMAERFLLIAWQRLTEVTGHGTGKVRTVRPGVILSPKPRPKEAG